MHDTSPAHLHLMHYTSPAHPQEKKQEYQIDYPQRLVSFAYIILRTYTIPVPAKRYRYQISLPVTHVDDVKLLTNCYVAGIPMIQ